MATSRDVARAAGVSQATVSRVLNSSKPVSEDVRARVMQALESTGYVLNAQAKAMRTSRSGSVGLVTSDIRNPYFPLLLDELTRASNDLGLKAVVWDDRAADGKDSIEAYASGSVDGLILTSLRIGSPEVDELRRRGAPFVLCNRAPADVPADVVMADHEDMAYRITRYVAQAGRTNIAAVFGERDSVATPFRRRGVERALAEHGMDLDVSHVRDGRTAYETGKAAALDLLSSGVVFDTLICTSDVLAYGALDAMRQRGLRVPEDVWVTGVDGLPMSAWGALDLTTVEQNIPEIAQRSVAALAARIDGDRSPFFRDLIESTLVIRGSTAHHTSEPPLG